MNIEIVGKFFDNHSLSIVNRNLAIELDKIFENTDNKIVINKVEP